MILLLLFDAGVTSEEVIPDHEYWISFMVQYQKEKEYVEKILTCRHAICMLNRDEKGFIFICSFYFSFCWTGESFSGLSDSRCRGIEDGMEDDGTEGGAGWESLVKFELIRLLPSLQLIIH